MEGMKVSPGSPAAARSYVESDRSRVDHDNLPDGTGLAGVRRHPGGCATPTPRTGRRTSWAASFDETGNTKGSAASRRPCTAVLDVVTNSPDTASGARGPLVRESALRSQDRSPASIGRRDAQWGAHGSSSCRLLIAEAAEKT